MFWGASQEDGEEAEISLAATLRLVSNVWGPRCGRMFLLCSAVPSTVLCRAPVRNVTVKMKKYKGMLYLVLTEVCYESDLRVQDSVDRGGIRPGMLGAV